MVIRMETISQFISMLPLIEGNISYDMAMQANRKKHVLFAV